MPVRFTASVAGHEHAWDGRLVRMDASVDPATRMLYAIAEVEDPYGAGVSDQGMPMAVGLFVDAQINGREVNNAIRIPSKGLRPGNQIYVVDGDGRLQIRTAAVEYSNNDYAVISSGLAPGERVVVSALRNAISGMALTTIDDDAYATREG